MGGGIRSRRLARYVIALVALVTLMACSLASLSARPFTPKPPSTQPPAPRATAAPPTATPATPFIVRVMTYNIRLGAGVEPGHAEQPKNHLGDLTQVVKEANPDLLGLEEANGWNTGNPPKASSCSPAGERDLGDGSRRRPNDP